MTNKKEYLGDGVYAENDDYHIILSTDREGRTERIYLDDYVYEALIAFVNREKGNIKR